SLVPLRGGGGGGLRGDADRRLDDLEVGVGQRGGHEPGLEAARRRVDAVFQQCVEERRVAEGGRGLRVGEVPALPLRETRGEEGGGALAVVGDALGRQRAGQDARHAVGVGRDDRVHRLVGGAEAGQAGGHGNGVTGQGARLVDGA